MDILFQDRRIVVAVKPSGVLSTDEPGGMPALLRQELHTECIRTVHRLDAPVSGLMVFARSAYAAGDLSRQIREGTFEKHYLAVLRGAPPEREGTLTDLLARDKETRLTHVVTTREKGVQEARLRYRVLDSRAGLALVQIQLLTGRTHQIRVQFAHAGWPLLGDTKYGNTTVAGTAGSPAYRGVALCAYSLDFTHPGNGKKMSFRVKPQNPAFKKFTKIPSEDIFEG